MRTSPKSRCRATAVMLGECTCLMLGNISQTPGGLTGMLLNNEVHSLTSPSKAKFPCCPFQQPFATLTRVTPLTVKKTHHNAPPPRQAQWLPSQNMKNKQVHYQSLMPGYSHNYHGGMTCSVWFAIEESLLPNHLLLLCYHPPVMKMGQGFLWAWEGVEGGGVLPVH